MRASGAAAATIARSSGTIFSSHQRAASGNDSSRSVSPVGAQSIDDHLPLPGGVVFLEPQQREELVHPGRHGQLLGRDAVEAALHQQLAEPVLHALPMAS